MTTTTDELDRVWPDRPEVRQRPCPTCHAAPDEPCVTRVYIWDPVMQKDIPEIEEREDHHYLRR